MKERLKRVTERRKALRLEEYDTVEEDDGKKVGKKIGRVKL